MIKPLKRKAFLIKSLNQQWSQKCSSISIRRIVIRWIVVSRWWYGRVITRVVYQSIKKWMFSFAFFMVVYYWKDANNSILLIVTPFHVFLCVFSASSQFSSFLCSNFCIYSHFLLWHANTLHYVEELLLFSHFLYNFYTICIVVVKKDPRFLQQHPLFFQSGFLFFVFFTSLKAFFFSFDSLRDNLETHIEMD